MPNVSLLIGMSQEATYLWEDDDDRLVAAVYDLILISVQYNSVWLFFYNFI